MELLLKVCPSSSNKNNSFSITMFYQNHYQPTLSHRDLELLASVHTDSKRMNKLFIITGP